MANQNITIMMNRNWDIKPKQKQKDMNWIVWEADENNVSLLYKIIVYPYV